MVKRRVNSVCRGFTLVELLVGLVVAALIATATVTSLSQLARARDTSRAMREARARADEATVRIANDLQSVLRDHQLTFTRVNLPRPLGGSGSGEILMLVRQLTPVRGDDDFQEGGECEVQYRVLAGAPGSQRTALWRRIDPAFDLAQDAGGIAAPVVSGVVSVQFQAWDGSSWFDSWDSDVDGLPHAVRVSAEGVSDDGRTRAVARRVVAIPRVPVPPEPADEEDAAPESGQPSGSGTGTSGTGTTPGGTGGSGGTR